MEDKNQHCKFVNLLLILILTFLQALNNTGERLYLSPMFRNLFVSDAKKAVVYDITTGSVRNIIHYPKHKRQGKEVNSQDPDISAYAQTGVSIWELKRVEDKLVVVHDIERFNPVIVDFIDLLDPV